MSTLPIKTVYSWRGDIVKTNRAADINRAIGTCVLHMQINQYGANLAEVYHADSEQLYATIKRSMNGDVMISYRDDPRKYETRYAISPLLTKA